MPPRPELSPLSLRDLIDRGFELTRREARRLFLLALTINVATLLVGPGLRRLWMRSAEPLPLANLSLDLYADDWPLLIGDSLIRVLSTCFEAGILILVLEEAFWGRTVRMGSVLQAFVRRAMPLALALGTISLVLALIVLGPFFGALALWDPPMSATIAECAMLIVIVPAIVLALRWGLTAPVASLERVTPLAALRRSRELLRSSSEGGGAITENPWVRLALVFGLRLLFELVVELGLILLPQLLPPSTGSWRMIGQTLMNLIAETLVAPLFWAFILLIYYDRRARREGLDLEHRAAELVGESL